MTVINQIGSFFLALFVVYFWLMMCVVVFFGMIALIVYAILTHKPSISKEQIEKNGQLARQEAQKEEREERDRIENERLNLLRQKVHLAFQVELDQVHNSEVQDEIVRIVNLYAIQAATACVNQDKASRCLTVPPYKHPSARRSCKKIWWEYGAYELFFEEEESEYGLHAETPVSWNEVAKQMKIAWACLKNLAIEACPDIKDRLPHFSEFEPLKSYNAEHLLQKRAKQAVA